MSDNNLIPAVLYARMSGRDQEKSPGQQKAEMLPRCRLERVQVVAEFLDEAISGGGMRRRDAYLAMLAFCKKRHAQGDPVRAVVCWNTDRFSRATSMETAHYIWEFQQAGVHRVLTWERWFDFRKEEDRAIFLLQQDFTNNRYLRNLSENILRGKKGVAAAGYFTGGTVPYAFDRLLLDEAGQVVQRVHRGEKIGHRQKTWKVALAPIDADDPDPARQLERQTAVWLFESFDARHVSQRRLAAELNERNVPGPGTGYGRPCRRKDAEPTDPLPWTVAAVKAILTNPVYGGVQEVGRGATGAYHRLAGSAIVAVEPGTPRRYHGGGEPIRCTLEHGGLVDAALWRRVQAKLAERARAEGARKRSFPRSGGGYCLPSGVLYCGHCGGRMYGCTCRPRRGDKQYEYKNYRCGTNATKAGTCGSYAVREQVILDKLTDRLLQVYLSEERLAGLEAQLADRAGARHAQAPDRAARLARQREALDADIRRAAQNVLRCRDNVDLLNEQLTQLRQKREKLTREVEEAEKEQARPAVAATEKVAEAFARLRDLRAALARARPEDLAAVLRCLVSRVDVYFKPVEKGRRRWFAFAKGVVKFRPVLDVSPSDAHLR
jgi:DNA invertase Pin-like site-specific DNA recombinase